MYLVITRLFIANESIMKNLNVSNKDRKKGLRTSLAIHGSLILLALLPFMKNQVDDVAEDWQVVEIAFVNSDISSGVSSEAPKEVKEMELLNSHQGHFVLAAFIAFGVQVVEYFP